jgi:hypothetical protein
MGIKGTRAVRVKRGEVKNWRGCEKIPTVNDNLTKQTLQNMT